MRVLLAPAVTSRDRSTSIIHTKSLRPPQTHSSYKVNVLFHLLPKYLSPHSNLYHTAQSNISPFSTSRCPSMIVSIIETGLYTKPTDEHQYLFRSSCHPSSCHH